MIRSFPLNIIRHCQCTEYTQKTTSVNENKINIYLVRREQHLENLDRKHLGCLQTKMHAQYGRYKRPFKPPIKKVKSPRSPFSTISTHTRNTEYSNQRKEARVQKYSQF